MATDRGIFSVLRGVLGARSGDTAFADAARDRGDWLNAAKHYQEALAVEPGRADLWVQLGHALKESGDREGGLSAYLRANALDPRNSDTALQIGHVLKLLDRHPEVIEWYSRAVTWHPVQMPALRELVAMGVAPEKIEALIADGDRVQGEPIRRPNPQPGRLVWDVSSLLDPIAGGHEPGMDALWTAHIAASMCATGKAEACRLDPHAAAWMTSSDPTTLAAVLAGDRSAADAGVWSRPADLTAVTLLLPSIPAACMPTRVALALDIARNAAGPAVAVLVPSMSIWQQRAAVAATGQRERSIELLDALLAAASIVLVPSAYERGLIEGQISDERRAGRIFTLGMGTDVQPAASSARSLHLALLPEDDAELAGILGADRRRDKKERLAFVLPANMQAADARRLVDRHGAGGVDVEFLDTAAAAAALPQSDCILVPASRCDGDTWIVAAADAGVRVVASTASAACRARSALVADYEDLSDVERLSECWRALGERGPHLMRPQVEHWSSRIGDGMRASETGREVDPISLGRGVFASMARRGNGLAFRTSAAWGEPVAYGSPVAPQGARLRVPVRLWQDEPLQISFLIAAPMPTAGSLTVSLSAADQPPLELSAPLPREGWGWVRFACPLRTSHRVQLLDLRLSFLDDAGDAIGGDVVVAGLITYQASRDHLWHEFLDRASRGQVPELRSLRNWVRRQRPQRPAT